ncbi:glycogen debranching N-terminal domain-containing protein [Streptomyces sp. NPDC096193]|uniref:glycogen debranching N-terminal domain-containing protein n=1 Tax=Streptomyces sp. NPDC096193 TaxID=3155821 RepID=UPI00333493D3
MQSQLVAADRATFVASVRAPSGTGPDPDVSVERSRDADGTERITLCSFAPGPIRLPVEIALGTDLADLGRDRGGTPRSRTPAQRPRHGHAMDHRHGRVRTRHRRAGPERRPRLSGGAALGRGPGPRYPQHHRGPRPRRTPRPPIRTHRQPPSARGACRGRRSAPARPARDRSGRPHGAASAGPSGVRGHVSGRRCAVALRAGTRRGALGRPDGAPALHPARGSHPARPRPHTSDRAGAGLRAHPRTDQGLRTASAAELHGDRGDARLPGCARRGLALGDARTGTGRAAAGRGALPRLAPAGRRGRRISGRARPLRAAACRDPGARTPGRAARRRPHGGLRPPGSRRLARMGRGVAQTISGGLLDRRPTGWPSGGRPSPGRAARAAPGRRSGAPPRHRTAGRRPARTRPPRQGADRAAGQAARQSRSGFRLGAAKPGGEGTGAQPVRAPRRGRTGVRDHRRGGRTGHCRIREGGGVAAAGSARRRRVLRLPAARDVRGAAAFGTGSARAASGRLQAGGGGGRVGDPAPDDAGRHPPRCSGPDGGRAPGALCSARCGRDLRAERGR